MTVTKAELTDGIPLDPLDQAELLDLTMKEYHRTRRFLGSSGVRMFLRSRPMFEGRYVSGTIPEPFVRRPMKLGTAAHAAALEPDTMDEVVAIVPNELLTREGQAWNEFVAEAGQGAYFVTPKEKEHLVVIPADLVGKNKNTKGWKELKAEHPDGKFVTAEEAEAAVVIPPHALRNGKLAATKEVDAFKKANRERVILKETDMDQVHGMVKAVMDHPLAGRLLEAEGLVEATVVFNLLGLAMKVRPDKLILTNPDEPWVFDLKFTQDPSPAAFARTLARMAYPIQAELYKEGVFQLTGHWPVFVFIAAGSEPPHDVWVYELSDKAASYGRTRLEGAVQDIQTCFDTNDWTNPGAADIRTLELPRWVDFESEYETNGDADWDLVSD